MVSRRIFTREFKLEVCRSVDSGSTGKGQACRTHAIGASLLRQWLDQFHAKGEEAFTGNDWRIASQTPESRSRELEAALGRAHLEIELLKEALAKKPSTPRPVAK
jgi:transposase-like protein